MGIRTEKWNVAFRPASDFRRTDNPYRKIPGDAGGWYADPFLLKKDGALWLFAEYFSYRFGRGLISCCRFDAEKQCFSAWKEVLCEPFHLSYPQVFCRGEDVYMLPETGEAGQLLLYRAVSFPDRWEKCAVLQKDVRWVDATLLPDEKRLIAYDIQGGEPHACLLASVENGRVLRDLTGLRPLLRSRPGGAVLVEGDNCIFPTQNCEKTYGGELVFYQTDPAFSSFSSLFTLSPDSLPIRGETAPVLGVHTYNRTDEIEVVDYKTETVSPVRILHRILQKTGVEK